MQKFQQEVQSAGQKAMQEALRIYRDPELRKTQNYRSMYGSYAGIEEAAKAEDMLKVDYSSDFVPAEDASASVKRQAAATDSFIWLNEPETMPGVIAALTGAEKGKEYEFKSEYPADYREAALAGKTVNYKVTVKDIQRRTKLEDAALLEKLQLKSMDELRDRLRKAQSSFSTPNERFFRHMYQSPHGYAPP